MSFHPMPVPSELEPDDVIDLVKDCAMLPPALWPMPRQRAVLPARRTDWARLPDAIVEQFRKDGYLFI